MSKKKALSVDEKRVKLLEVFHETLDFFPLKEVEKLGAKKGIVLNTVKEILEGLVADGLVTVKKRKQLEGLNEEYARLKLRKTELEAELNSMQDGREDSDERAKLLEDLNEQTRINSELKSELQSYNDCDPDVLASKERSALKARDAANRWTENIFSLQSYLCKNYNMESKQFFETFNIPENIDTV